jgi:hypothetical protein
MNDQFFDKFGFQMMQQNMAFMRLPHDIKGVFFEIRLMVGLSEYKDGTVPCGAAKRAKQDDLIEYLTYGDKSKQNYFRKALARLCASGVLHISQTGLVKLPYYEDEQALGRTVDTNRKRNKAQADLLELVNKAGTALKGLFRRSKAKGMPYEVLVDFLRKEFSCYRPKAEEILARMQESGVLYLCADGVYSLASLAPPPVSGSGLAGAGADYSGSRNIPLEPEPEPEQEGDFPNPQLAAGQAGRHPFGARAPHGALPPGAGGGGASEARYPPNRADVDSPDVLYEPGDAYRVPDPVHAAQLFLATKPGWSERPEGDWPASKHVVRAKWKELRGRLGPKEADALWRGLLAEIVEDHHEKGWWNWVGLFIKRLETAAAEITDSLKKLESYQPVQGAKEWVD